VGMTTQTSLVGFLLTLAALNSPQAQAIGANQITTVPEVSQPPTIESRLTRLSTVLQERTSPDDRLDATDAYLVAIGWRNGGNRGWVNGSGRGWTDGRNNRGSWVDTRRGGWSDGRGGNWVNISPWRNGWSDRGGFFNSR